MIKNWIKVFIYHLRQNKLFSILNTLGLAIGISGIIFAVLYWNEEHSYDAWNPEKDHVFQLINTVSSDMSWPYSNEPAGRYLKAVSPELESYCYTETGYHKDVVRFQDKKILIEKVFEAQQLFFNYFPFQFLEGSADSALKDENSMAIEENTAKKLFGNEKALGKQVFMSKKAYVVRGVYRLPGKSSMAPDLITRKIEQYLRDNKDQWGNFNFNLLLKLKNPDDKEKVEKQLEQVYLVNRTAKYAKEEGIPLDEFIKKNGTTKVLLEPLSMARLHSTVEGYPEGKGNYKFLLIMSGLSVLILLLSIVNYVNLATASAIKRAKEVGVRRIIGASKSNIVWQFLTETVITTVFSILLALAIVELALPFYNDFLGKQLQMNGSEFFLKIVGIFIVVVIVAGIFPAVYVSNFETLKVLKGNFGRSKSGVWLRNGMLVLQFAIATFFVIGSHIVYQQVHYMSTKDLGFKGEQVVDIIYRNDYDWKQPDYQKKLRNRYSMLKQEILKVPGVQSLTGGAFSFGNDANSSSGFTYNDHQVQAKNMAADFEFLDMMQIKMLEGRKLSAEYSSDTISSVLVNQTALRQMQEKQPLGKKFKWNGKEFTIVGVVNDFHIAGPQQEIPPMIFFHYKTVDWMLNNTNHIFVKIDPEKMEPALASIEKFWVKNIDNEYPFTYDFVDKNFARTYKSFVNQRNLFELLNAVVILIALFGLFALASFSIERRMKEIAIRKTLGAETSSLLKELSKQYLAFCIIGFAIAFFPTRMFLSKWLEDFAYQIEITTMPFILGFLILCTLTLVVVVAKAYKATRVDVLKYLKYE
ncbi:ABC transporter permease [Flavobacterium sp. MAH-1]|uniref:ABC transporter permease n=1 Tax=Flavobacterium agri TaxID=2743471 RepID=A0A7Y8Y140_9FLAO|nr:ABC transporter permease [Flavobacterium agri]NUY80625.1 ABC transporter permease [Flavobacterium agri]NYA70649.1 ABC transporter permease [Flavobacterium agri]